MIYIKSDSYVLSKEEYQKLTNPDVTYTLMTKTAANKVVKNILKYGNFECWHDAQDYDFSMESFCMDCPVMEILGDDGGRRICLREKRWP